MNKAMATEKAWLKRRQKKWQASKHTRRAKLGVTLADYERMLRAQGGRCKICRKIPKSRRLCVDHDHATLRVRGLLCISCNTKLGWYERFRVRIERYLRPL